MPPRCHVEEGDAFDLIPKLAPDSVDLVITSPPYWGLRTYQMNHDWSIADAWRSPTVPDYAWYRDHGGALGLEPFPEWYLAHVAEILDLVKGCLKQEGSIWVNLGDTYFARWASIREEGRQGLAGAKRARRRTPMGGFRQEKQLLLIPSRFAIAFQDKRWILRNDLIWHKPNVPPRPESDRLRLAHEHFFHFVRRAKVGRPKYHYDLDEVEPGGNDVVTCTVRAGREGHTATFPEALIAPRIRSSCPPGGTVLDPFCGTGSALAAAVASGRSAIGFDASPSFAQAARERLQAIAHSRVCSSTAHPPNRKRKRPGER
jgi:DNA modification methylase